MKHVPVLTPPELRQIRKEQKLTQKQTAQIMGLKSYRIISEFENGKSGIPKWECWWNLQIWRRKQS